MLTDPISYGYTCSFGVGNPMSLRHEITHLKAADFDKERRLRALEEMVDLLLEAEEETAEELAEHEVEDAAEHAAIVRLVDKE